MAKAAKPPGAAPPAPPLRPTTTAEENRASLDTREESGRVSVGQRRINLIWEQTQAWIAIAVVGTDLLIEVIGAVLPHFRSLALVPFHESTLKPLVYVVIGFYFGRTNHQRTGGVGLNEKGR